MKKITLLLCSLFLAIGSWAADYTVSLSTGTFLNKQNGAIEVPVEGTKYVYAWQSSDTAPQLTLSCPSGKNNMVIDTDVRLATDQYALEVPGGFIITGYQFNAYTGAASASVTPEGQDAISISTDAAMPTTVAVMGLSANKAVFDVSAGNPWMYVTDFVVSIDSDPNYVAPIASAAELSNDKAYTLTVDRGSLGVSDGLLVATSKAGFEASTFALVQYDGNFYLYSTVAKGYINAKGEVTAINPDPITFKDLGGSKFQLMYGENYVNVSSSYTSGLVINSWSTADAGNQFTIMEAESFDATEALKAFQKLYFETDLTAQFPLDWQGWQGATGFVGWAAPQVTTNDGRTTAACEQYNEATIDQTGVVFSRQLTGLANGIYTIELFGAAAFTPDRSCSSTLEEGDETAVYLYAETAAGKVQKFIPAHVADNFNGSGIATAVLEGVEIVDGTVTIGMYKEQGLTNWHVVQIKGVTATVEAASVLAQSIAAAKAVDAASVPAALATTISEAITANNTVFDTVEEYQSAINALDALVAQAAKYAPLAAALAQGADFKAHVVEGAEAISTYDAAINDVKAAYDAVAVEDFDAAIATVKAANDELAKAQTLAGADMTAFIVNAEVNGADGWTCERPNGGNGPLLNNVSFEYWAGNATSRDAAAFDYYQEITGLPNGVYAVSADMFNSLNAEANAVFAATSGLYAVSGTYEASALVDADTDQLANYALEIIVTNGTLRIGVKNVESPMAARWFVADNFKLKLVSTFEDPLQLQTAMANASFKDGREYRVFTMVGEDKYYLTATGHLTADLAQANMFTFSEVKADGTLYATGWNLGCKFTNPSLTGGSTGDVVNDGHIHVGTNNRNDWERQVFFLNDEGKYAVRATNANSANWGANTYWDVFSESELPQAGYSLNAAYVWNVEAYVDNSGLKQLVAEVLAVINASDTYTAEDGVVTAATEALAAYADAEYATVEDVNAAKAQVMEIANTFLAAITPVESIDVTKFYIVNANALSKEGWEGTDFGTASDGVCEYWNKAAAEFHQTINLPAGTYQLTGIALTRTNMQGSIYAGEQSADIATVESTVANSRAQAAAWFAADAANGRSIVYFTLDEATSIEIGLKADAATGDHWTVWQGFTLAKINPESLGNKEIEQARANLIAALNAVSAAADNMNVGALFQPTEAGQTAFANTFTEVQAVADNEAATLDELKAALQTLAEAKAAYDVAIVLPEEGALYTFKQKDVDLYLSVYADKDEGGNITANGVRLSDVPQAFTWVPAEGGYYLKAEDLYVGLEGSNNWTMSALEEKKLVIKANILEQDGLIYYTLSEAKGIIGTDALEAGAACYANKAAANNGLWVIEEAPAVTFTVTPSIESGSQTVVGTSEGFNTVEYDTPFTLSVAAENLEVYGYDPSELTISFQMVMAAYYNTPAWTMGADTSKRIQLPAVTVPYAEEITLEDIVFDTAFPYVQSISLIGISLKKGDETVATIAAPVMVRFLEVYYHGVPVGINAVNAVGKAATIFDLSGRKVENVQKGGVYIVNGKKVSVK